MNDNRLQLIAKAAHKVQKKQKRWDKGIANIIAKEYSSQRRESERLIPLKFD